MPKEEKPKRTWGTILKNIFFIFIILQLAPAIFMNFRTQLSEAVSPKTQVGFLKIKGMITDSGYYVKHIHKFLENSSIKALLIKIDSGGGTSGSSQAIFNELKKFKKQKPIVVLIEDICASGAYLAASAANKILAQPSSVIGSIGVMLGMQGMPLPNLTDRMEDWKIKFEYVQAGKYKTAGNFFRKNTPEELKHLQSTVDDTYLQFVSDIAEQRKLNPKKEKVWADGKIFTGNQALKLNMIDKIGSMRDAIDAVKEIANIKTEVKLVQPTRPTGLMAMLSGDQGYAGPSASAPAAIGRMLSSVWMSFVLTQAQNNGNKLVM